MSHIINNNLSSPRTENKKRSTGSLAPRSKAHGTLNSGRRTLSVPPSKCSLCERKIYKLNHNLISITHKTLYTKYASSQNYYYTKDINELLSDSHTPVVILHKDMQTFDESEEYLKRLYKSSEYNNKIKLLAEYYKFHWDIPRLFMLPITEVVNRYHDRKRRLQYIKVTKMLKDQKESKNHQHKVQTESKPKNEEVKPMSIADKLLIGLETSHSIIKQEAQRQQDERGIRTSRGQGGDTQRRRESNRVQEAGIREQRQKQAEEEVHRTTFNTLQDLNLKLGEIVSNSKFNLTDTNYLDGNDKSLNESLSNLKNFLNYLQSNAATSNTMPQPMSEITKIAQQEQSQVRPVLADSTKRTTAIKSITPRIEKPREENPEKEGLKSTRVEVMSWKRVDSNPLITPSPSDMARRGSTGTKEVTKGEEKAKEGGHAVNYGAGHVSSGQSSLSSTMTSKSKSAYSSVTKIRNFEEAVKISQQNSQMKLASPVDPTKYGHKPVLLRVNASGGPQDINQREASPSTEFIYKGMDSSIKTPVGFSEDKSKESSSNNKESSPLSKQNSQLLSPVGQKPMSGNKPATTKNMNIYSTRTMEGFMPRSPEMMSPPNQSPNFRIKSHREVSFDKNANIQPSSTKPVPQIQLPLAKNHTRFGSGTLASPTVKNAGKTGTPSMAIQSGRELKNLMALGTLDIPLKETKVMPSSASRREALLAKSDSKGEGFVKGSEGSATDRADREREAPPLSPKMSGTPRMKVISHKHTRSEGGKMLKFDQFELPMGSLNEQRIKELMKLGEAGIEAFGDGNQKFKKGELLSKKMGSYSGNNNIANLVMSSNRELHYDNSVSTAPASQKKHQTKASGDLAINGNNGALMSTRSTKADVIVRKKSQLKKGDEIRQKNAVSPGLVIDKFDEPAKLGRPKALTMKGSGSFTPSSFAKGTVPSKTKGKQDFF